MSTENETWRDASSSEENSGAGRDGNQFNREGGYSRPAYNRENSDRPYRPRYNSESGDRPQRPYNSDRPQRPYNSDRPQRPYNNDRSYGSSDRPYRPRYNSENNGDRPQRPYGNNAGGDRPYRPRYDSNAGGRPGGYGSRDSYSRPIRRSADYDPNAKYSKKKQIEYKEQFVDPNDPIRLNKFLANAGVCSRRDNVRRHCGNDEGV